MKLLLTLFLAASLFAAEQHKGPFVQYTIYALPVCHQSANGGVDESVDVTDAYLPMMGYPLRSKQGTSHASVHCDRVTGVYMVDYLK